MANLTEIAIETSAQARSEVLALLSSDRFRLKLNETCPALASIDSEHLLQRLQDEVFVFKLMVDRVWFCREAMCEMHNDPFASVQVY